MDNLILARGATLAVSPLFLVLVLTMPALAPEALAEATPKKPRQPSWLMTSEDNGIRAWKREVPGSDVIALRGEGVVHATIARVASVLFDYARAPEWIDSVEEVRVVRMLTPLEFIEYNHVRTPPIIMKDRDFVCRGKVTIDPAAQSLELTMVPAVDPALPETGHVRGELHGYWKLRAIDGGKKTLVLAEMHGDPKGGVAKWIVNLFQKNWARNTLESLRAQVAKPNIKILPQVKDALEGKPLRLTIKPK